MEEKLIKKYTGRMGWLFAMIVVTLLLGSITMFVWLERGPNIEDFTGSGKAEILSMEIDPSSEGLETHIRYHYQARLTIAGQTSIVSGKRSGGWHVGDVLPVTFNWKDPSQYVIGTTPQEYIPYYRHVRTAAISFMAVAAVGIFFCVRYTLAIRRIKNRIKQSKKKNIPD